MCKPHEKRPDRAVSPQPGACLRLPVAGATQTGAARTGRHCPGVTAAKPMYAEGVLQSASAEHVEAPIQGARRVADPTSNDAPDPGDVGPSDLRPPGDTPGNKATGPTVGTERASAGGRVFCRERGTAPDGHGRRRATGGVSRHPATATGGAGGTPGAKEVPPKPTARTTPGALPLKADCPGAAERCALEQYTIPGALDVSQLRG